MLLSHRGCIVVEVVVVAVWLVVRVDVVVVVVVTANASTKESPCVLCATGLKGERPNEKPPVPSWRAAPNSRAELARIPAAHLAAHRDGLCGGGDNDDGDGKSCSSSMVATRNC